LSHPHLAGLKNLLHPFGLVALLHSCEVGVMHSFCDTCPAETLNIALPELLRHCSTKQLATVLAPLLNDASLHQSLVLILQRVDARRIARIINNVLPEKLDIVLRCPANAVVALVNTVEDGRIPSMLQLVNYAPSALFALLTHAIDCDKAASVVNHVDAEVILGLLGRVSSFRIARVLEAFPPADFGSGGRFIQFLKHLEGERKLTQDKVAPFLQLIDPEVVARLVQGVDGVQLLEVLRSVGAEGVARILENTNIDLIISMWNGPLELAVSLGAGPLSALQKDARAAKAIKAVTDKVQLGIEHCRPLMRATVVTPAAAASGA